MAVDYTQWSLQKKVASGFAVLGLILLVVAITTVQSLREYKSSTDWIEHTGKVLGQIERVRYELREAESHQRGYVITGQEAYLEMYYKAKHILVEEGQHLGKLTRDNPVQVKAHNQLSDLIRQRTERMEKVVVQRQTQGRDAAMKNIATGKGSQLSQQMLAVLDQMRLEEQRLLEKRNTSADARGTQAIMMIALAAVMIAVLLVMVYMLVNWEIRYRETAETSLKESEERYMMAVQSTNDGLWDWDLQHDKMYLSPRWKAILGYEDSEIGSSTTDWIIRIHPDDQDGVMKMHDELKRGERMGFESEYRMRHKEGHYVWVLVRGMGSLCDPNNKPTDSRMKDVEVCRVVGAMTDITLRKRYEEELLHKATHDALTGLPNREHFREQLSRTMSAARRHNFPISLCLCDLDKFKHINDTYGHGWGDRVIQKFAQIIQEEIRTEDLAARLGGDEFCIMFPHTEAEKVKNLLERIRKELADTPFTTDDGEKFFITGSFGVAQLSPTTESLKHFMDAADAALYRAKEHRNEVEIDS